MDSAEDKINPIIGIVLIQSSLKIRGLTVIVEIYGAPFNVEDAVRRSTRDRGEHAASAGEVRAAAQTYIGAIIAPDRKDRVVKGPDVGWRRQTG